MADIPEPSPSHRARSNEDLSRGGQKIEVRRSARRKKTVTAYRDGDTLVVLLPAKMSRREEAHWVAEMERKLQRSEQRRASPARASDEALLARCAQLSAQYLPASPPLRSVTWVPAMRSRWASCTPADAAIRVSDQLKNVPSWVLDYVLTHELAHLQVASHNAQFWSLVRQYPKTERAIGFLEGLSAAASFGTTNESPISVCEGD